MSYAALGQDCPAGHVLYQGTCLTPEEQDEIGPTLCKPDESWVTTPSRGCRCKSPMTRNPVTGECEIATDSPQASSLMFGLAAIGAGALAYIIYTEVGS